MLITPILKSDMPISTIRPFDATKDYEFIFYVNGGDQVLRNNLVIKDLETNEVVYDENQETFAFIHILPANTLKNGKAYKAKIRTGGINNTWSQFSESQMFYCFSPAIITIPTIDYNNQNRVYNQTVLFEATYTQPEGEQLQSYRFLLYNENKNLIKSFPEKFYQNEDSLTQEIAGLQNGKLYYIQIKTESVNGLLSETNLIWFKPFYITPKLSVVLFPENLPEQGAIKLSANIVQIIGKLYDNNGKLIDPNIVEYIDDEWLDLTRLDYDKLVFDNAFDILQNDFIMKIWCKNILDNKTFLILYSPYGNIKLIKYDNRIHAFKTNKYHNIKSHFVSDVFNFVDNNQYMIYLKQVNNLIDILIKPY